MRVYERAKDWLVPLRVTYDSEADAAYITSSQTSRLLGWPGRVPVGDGSERWMVNLDVDLEGRILGLEVLDARSLLSAALLE